MGDGREAHPGTDRSDSGPAGSARQPRDDAGRLQRHALLHNPLQPRHRAGRQHRRNDLGLRSAHGRMGPAAGRDGVRAPWRCGVDRARRTPRLPRHPLAADCAGRSYRRARRVLRAPRRDRPHRESALAHEADGRTGRVNIEVASSRSSSNPGNRSPFRQLVSSRGGPGVLGPHSSRDGSQPTADRTAIGLPLSRSVRDSQRIRKARSGYVRARDAPSPESQSDSVAPVGMLSGGCENHLLSYVVLTQLSAWTKSTVSRVPVASA